MKDPSLDTMVMKEESIAINEAQLLLAEKRTSMAFMRTGIAVFSLPLSALSILIATSKYYEIQDVLYFLIPLLAICAGLIVLGVFLVTRSVLRIRTYDSHIHELKKKNARLKDLIEE